MISLAVRQLFYQRRAWIGVWLACAVTTFVVASVLNVQEALGSIPQVDFGSFGFPIIALTLITGVSVVAAAVSLALATVRTELALLSLAGVLPGQASRLIYAQVAIVAFIGSIVGLLVAIIASPSLTSLIALRVLEIGILPETVWLSNPALAVLLVLGTALLAATRGARDAARLSPLDGLRASPTGTARRMGVARWIILFLGVALAAYAIFTMLVGPELLNRLMSTTDEQAATANAISAVSNGTLMFVVAMTAILAAISPFIIPVVARAWTALIPESISPVWFVARRNALSEPARTVSAVMPLGIAVSIISGIYSALQTTSNALLAQGSLPEGISTDVNSFSIVTVLFGPLLLSFLAAIMANLIDARRRETDLQHFRLAGATDARLLLSVILEAAVYTISAYLFGIAVAAFTSFVALIAFAMQGIMVGFHVALIPGAAAALIGFVFLLVTLSSISGIALRSDRTPIWRSAL